MLMTTTEGNHKATSRYGAVLWLAFLLWGQMVVWSYFLSRWQNNQLLSIFWHQWDMQAGFQVFLSCEKETRMCYSSSRGCSRRTRGHLPFPGREDMKHWAPHRKANVGHCYSQAWTEVPFIWQEFRKPNSSSDSLASSILSSSISVSLSTCSDFLFHDHLMVSAAVTNYLSTSEFLGSHGFCFLPSSCVFCCSPPYCLLMLFVHLPLKASKRKTRVSGCDPRYAAPWGIYYHRQVTIGAAACL